MYLEADDDSRQKQYVFVLIPNNSWGSTYYWVHLVEEMVLLWVNQITPYHPPGTGAVSLPAGIDNSDVVVLPLVLRVVGNCQDTRR